MKIEEWKHRLLGGSRASSFKEFYQEEIKDGRNINKIGIDNNSLHIEGIKFEHRGSNKNKEQIHSNVVNSSIFEQDKFSYNRSDYSAPIAKLIPDDRNTKLSSVLHEIRQMKSFIKSIKSYYQSNKIHPYSKHYASTSKLFDYNSHTNNPIKQSQISSYIKSTQNNLQNNSNTIDSTFKWMQNNNQLMFTIDASNRKSHASQSPTRSSCSP